MKRGVHNLVSFVVGRKGSGKSTLTAAMIAEHKRVFIVDTMAEYGPEQGCAIVEGFDACADAITAHENAKRFRLSLRVDDTEEALDLLTILYEVRSCLVVVEEASFYCTPSRLPVEISRLVRLGRHRQIDQIYVSQRPASVHRDVTAAADLIIAFQTHEPRDVAYFRALAGDDGERVRELPPFKVLVFGDVEKAPLPVIECLHVSLDKDSRRE